MLISGVISIYVEMLDGRGFGAKYHYYDRNHTLFSEYASENEMNKAAHKIKNGVDLLSFLRQWIDEFDYYMIKKGQNGPCFYDALCQVYDICDCSYLHISEEVFAGDEKQQTTTYHLSFSTVQDEKEGLHTLNKQSMCQTITDIQIINQNKQQMDGYKKAPDLDSRSITPPSITRRTGYVDVQKGTPKGNTVLKEKKKRKYSIDEKEKIINDYLEKNQGAFYDLQDAIDALGKGSPVTSQTVANWIKELYQMRVKEFLLTKGVMIKIDADLKSDENESKEEDGDKVQVVKFGELLLSVPEKYQVVYNYDQDQNEENKRLIIVPEDYSIFDDLKQMPFAIEFEPYICLHDGIEVTAQKADWLESYLAYQWNDRFSSANEWVERELRPGFGAFYQVKDELADDRVQTNGMIITNHQLSCFHTYCNISLHEMGKDRVEWIREATDLFLSFTYCIGEKKGPMQPQNERFRIPIIEVANMEKNKTGTDSEKTGDKPKPEINEQNGTAISNHQVSIDVIEQKRRELEQEKRDQELILKENTGLKGLIGRNASKRKQALARIEEIRKQIALLDEIMRKE